MAVEKLLALPSLSNLEKLSTTTEEPPMAIGSDIVAKAMKHEGVTHFFYISGFGIRAPPGSPNVPENSTIYEGRANQSKGRWLVCPSYAPALPGNAPAAFRGAMRGILRVNSNAPVQCA